MTDASFCLVKVSCTRNAIFLELAGNARKFYILQGTIKLYYVEKKSETFQGDEERNFFRCASNALGKRDISSLNDTHI